MTRVVNLYKEPFTVYIGRRNSRISAARNGGDGYFGNPISLDACCGDRELCLSKFRDYFYSRLDSDKDFMRRVHALKGETLGCFCKPKACHGDVIVEYLNACQAEAASLLTCP